MYINQSKNNTMQEFYVYQIDDKDVPYITENILPDPWIREVRKFAKGRASRREAIRRVLGVNLDETMSTQDINDFVAKNLFKTKKWREYEKVRDEVEKEVCVKELKTHLMFTLKIDTDTVIPASDIKLLPKRYGSPEDREN